LFRAALPPVVVFLQQGLHAGLPDLFRTLKQRGLTISLDTNESERQWMASSMSCCHMWICCYQ